MQYSCTLQFLYQEHVKPKVILLATLATPVDYGFRTDIYWQCHSANLDYVVFFKKKNDPSEVSKVDLCKLSFYSFDW